MVPRREPVSYLCDFILTIAKFFRPAAGDHDGSGIRPEGLNRNGVTADISRVECKAFVRTPRVVIQLTSRITPRTLAAYPQIKRTGSVRHGDAQHHRSFCLFSIAPCRDCSFHPRRLVADRSPSIVTVALILPLTAGPSVTWVHHPVELGLSSPWLSNNGATTCACLDLIDFVANRSASLFSSRSTCFIFTCLKPRNRC